jgi:serine/threonine protein kinase
MLCNWLYGISSGVEHLHSQGILHGDLKAANILLYPDQTVRITDYTLCSYIAWKIRGNIYTSTHRPPEVWKYEEYDLSADIWALGCTFFEIVYGYSLFPHQGKAKNEIDAAVYFEANVANILDWGNYRHGTPRGADITRHKIELPAKFDPSIQDSIDNLIYQMLTVPPLGRPTIAQVLAHPYFSSNPRVITIKLDPFVKTASSKKLVTLAMKHTQRPEIISIVERLLSRLIKVRFESDDLKVAACLWIASKMVQLSPLKSLSEFPFHKLIEAEALICNTVGFALI